MEFASPFSTAQQIHELAGRYLQEDALQEVKDADTLAAGADLLRNVNVVSNLQSIFRWKLQSFAKRFPWVKEWPDGIAEPALAEAVSAAQNATSDDTAARHALQKLDNLPKVGIPVASAFLTAMFPEHFTVIDRQAYKALGTPFKDGINDYLEYLTFCRQEAARWDVSLRDHDRALWQFGAEMSRKARMRHPSSASGKRHSVHEM